MLRESLVKLTREGSLAPPVPVMLSAPRGVGKTVLLNWLRTQAKTTRARVVKTYAKHISTMTNLVNALAPELIKEARDDGWNVSLAVSGAGYAPGAPVAEPDWAGMLKERLLNECDTKPLLLCVDEAHTMSVDVLTTLANIVQELLEVNRPVWLVLAGTLGLRRHLLDSAWVDQVSGKRHTASFLTRSDELTPGLLCDADAKAALAQPLRDAGWEINDAALQEVIDDAQGYPYFLQIWGDALWRAGSQSRSRNLDKTLMKRAMPDVKRRRQATYSDRFHELYRSLGETLGRKRTLQAAGTVAQALLDSPELVLPDYQLSQELENIGLTDTECEALETLFRDTGFLVQHEDDWTPGIPSLAGYIYNRADIRGLLEPEEQPSSLLRPD